jgi:hypothetical protein
LKYPAPFYDLNPLAFSSKNIALEIYRFDQAESIHSPVQTVVVFGVFDQFSNMALLISAGQRD